MRDSMDERVNDGLVICGPNSITSYDGEDSLAFAGALPLFI